MLGSENRLILNSRMADEQSETGGAIMQVIEHIEINTGTTPQVRALIRTILDAATALARLLPNEELEQRFEFAWGHSNSPLAGEDSKD